MLQQFYYTARLIVVAELGICLIQDTFYLLGVTQFVLLLLQFLVLASLRVQLLQLFQLETQVILLGL